MLDVNVKNKKPFIFTVIDTSHLLMYLWDENKEVD